MTDSPAVRLPLDPTEQPILDKLLEIRTRLELLKQDRSTYVRSEDVINLYYQIIEQVHDLNEIRVTKRTEQNRVDTVLDDCFQLISLSFLTIGRNNEAPAVYSAVSTVKRLLDHLKEASFFSKKDIESIDHRLREYRESVARGKQNYDAHLLTLLEARIDVCEITLNELKQVLAQLTPELRPTYEKLVSILRSLSACNTRSKFPEAEVEELATQLKQIQSELEDGTAADDRPLADRFAEQLRFASAQFEEHSPDARKLTTDLLHRCQLWVEIVKEKQGKIDERFEDTYQKLLSIRNKLESLHLTQAWSLRETELYSYQRQLDRIDEARVDGNFIDAEGHPSDTLLYLLRKSYSLIYQLMISSEPVSEALLPIYNQLLTLRRCLREVKKHGGVSSPRELYPYSMKLNSIDNMKHDGKFMVGNDIPDGQGAVSELLAECFDLAYQLRVEAEENEKSSEEEADEKEERVDSATDGQVETDHAERDLIETTGQVERNTQVEPTNA